MLSLVLLSLLISSCSASRSSWATWSQEHEVCTARLSSSSSTKESVHCEESSYVDYFKKVIQSPPSDYHLEVAKTVLSMYQDLKDVRKPVVIPHPENSSATIMVHPISFAIPDENIVATVPPKLKAFGRVIPGIQSTYFHLFNETQYFQDMQKSLFTLTYKKGGWDCLRHYEILASGSLPLFMGIKHCPPAALTAHPKKIYALILKQPGLVISGKRTGQMTMAFEKLDMDLKALDPSLFAATVAATLQYTRNVLSTEAMAEYVLETMFHYSENHITSPHPKKILYLTHQDHDMDKGDYMTDFLLHGLKKLIGEKAVVDFPGRDCLYKTTKQFNETDYLQQRARLYGSGFSWGLRLDVFSGSVDRDFNEIKRNLIDHHYDVVILGSGHRDGWASKLHFWDLVCRHYHPLQVGYVDGADYHLRQNVMLRYHKCAGHIFSREGLPAPNS